MALTKPHPRNHTKSRRVNALAGFTLISPRSRISGSTALELRSTKHLSLLQSKIADRIKSWVDSCEHWPVLARSIAYKWLAEDLQDRPITRDLSWGVPVAYEGVIRSSAGRNASRKLPA